MGQRHSISTRNHGSRRSHGAAHPHRRAGRLHRGGADLSNGGWSFRLRGADAPRRASARASGRALRRPLQTMPWRAGAGVSLVSGAPAAERAPRGSVSGRHSMPCASRASFCSPDSASTCATRAATRGIDAVAHERGIADNQAGLSRENGSLPTNGAIGSISCSTSFSSQTAGWRRSACRPDHCCTSGLVGGERGPDVNSSHSESHRGALRRCVAGAFADPLSRGAR